MCLRHWLREWKRERIEIEIGICTGAEHYADDLEIDLEEIMGSDFNAELEDGSPQDVRLFDVGA